MKATSNRSGPPSVANPAQAGTTSHAGTVRAPVPKFVPSPVALEQAEDLFMEIALLAHGADRACAFFPAGNSEDLDHVEHADLELGRLRQVVTLIGWMADMGTAKLAGPLETLRGGADEWLLSPRYLAIEESAREVSHG